MNTEVKVGIVVTDENKKILLIKEKLEKKPVALWNIIKGTRETGETVFDAAKRECQEEVSLEVTLINALGVYILERPSGLTIQFNFIATALDVNASAASLEEQYSRSEAIEEIQWFTREEIESMSSEQFVSKRAVQAIHDFFDGKSLPLEAYRHIDD